MKRPVLTTAVLILGPFAIISLAIQSHAPTYQTERVCTHHARVTNTVYEQNSPKGYPPIAVRRTRTWCDEWSVR